MSTILSENEYLQMLKGFDANDEKYEREEGGTCLDCERHVVFYHFYKVSDGKRTYTDRIRVCHCR